jgi:CheY-like chemotaxis protein
METQFIILLVEDDPNDAFFVTRALEKLGFTGSVSHVTDVDAAKGFLLEYSASGPNEGNLVIIADSAVSCRGTGVDLLEWVRKRKGGRSVPFVILSGELCPKTIDRAHAASVDFILPKLQDSSDTIGQLRKVFLQMPPHCRAWLKE